MNYKLSDFVAYRFYEKEEGPLSSIRNYTYEEALIRGDRVGIINMSSIYNNRVKMENLLYNMFKSIGGQPKTKFPYYAAVDRRYCENSKLFMRFNKPERLVIPLTAFPKECISFTYGRSTKAMTRRDGHPTRRKLYMWDEAEWILNNIMYDEAEELWLEMQIWEQNTLLQYYKDGNSKSLCEVKGRLTEQEIIQKIELCKEEINLIKDNFFTEPFAPHGVAHAKRVLILVKELSDLFKIEDKYRDVLVCCAMYHDIGRETQYEDNLHGKKSYTKAEYLGLLPKTFDYDMHQMFQFIVENHCLNKDEAKNNLNMYQITDKLLAYKLFCIFVDADMLDLCRFGIILHNSLCNRESEKLIYFAYQLLGIVR